MSKQIWLIRFELQVHQDEAANKNILCETKIVLNSLTGKKFVLLKQGFIWIMKLQTEKPS